MRSYCFRKFGQVAEDKLNKRAKIYDKVQIHLLCEYGGCHVPEGRYDISICLDFGFEFRIVPSLIQSSKLFCAYDLQVRSLIRRSSRAPKWPNGAHLPALA
jgi:hypothetical protein